MHLIVHGISYRQFSYNFSSVPESTLLAAYLALPQKEKKIENKRRLKKKDVACYKCQKLEVVSITLQFCGGMNILVDYIIWPKEDSDLNERKV